MTKVRRNIVFPRANRSRKEIWEPDTRRGETRIDPDVPPRGFSVPFRPPPYDCWNRGGTDHGHIGRLLGARGSASRGLRRGTTPATTRSRLPNSATGGEQPVSFSLLSFFLRLLFAIERRSIDAKKAREIGYIYALRYTRFFAKCRRFYILLILML